MSYPNYPSHPPHHGQPQRRPDSLTPEERAAADAAVARVRAERDVAEAQARGRAAGDPHGLAHQSPAATHAAYGQQPRPAAAPRNGLGLAALIVALVGLLFALMPITGFLCVIAGLVAVPLALAGLGRVRRGQASNKGVTVAGLTAGLLALVAGIASMAMFFTIVDEAFPSQEAVSISGGGRAPAGPAPAAPAETEVSIASFGERVTFSDGLAVELSAPAAFTPSRTASGAGERAVRITVTVHNGSTEPFESILLTLSASHGGREASQVFDSAKGINGAPGTSVLPGRSATFDVVFALGGEPADLQVDVRAGFISNPATYLGRV